MFLITVLVLIERAIITQPFSALNNMWKTLARQLYPVMTAWPKYGKPDLPNKVSVIPYVSHLSQVETIVKMLHIALHAIMLRLGP